MAQQRSEFLRSLGKLFAIFKAVVDEVLALGGGDEHIANIGVNPTMQGSLAKQLAAVIYGKGRVRLDDSPENNFLRSLITLSPAQIAHFNSRAVDLNAILLGALWEAIRVLTYHEREIVKMRYGLGDGYGYTLDETGRIFKVTRDRIRQIESKAIGKLHTALNATPIVIELKERLAEQEIKEKSKLTAKEWQTWPINSLTEGVSEAPAEELAQN